MIVVVEMIEDAALQVLQTAHSVQHLDALPKDPQGRSVLLKGARALIVRNRTRVDGPLLDLSPHLKVVGRLGTGLDNLDLHALRSREITLRTGRGANAVAVAEWVLGYLFHVSKPYAVADDSVRSGGWDRRLGGTELFGKSLGIVGLGDIGRRLALRAHAMGMAVLATDPLLFPFDVAVEELGIRQLPLMELMQEADFVSLHVPFSPATRNLIGREELGAMKETAHLIHTSRGGVVDEEALAEALLQGRLAGALVDVQVEEPPPLDSPLLSAPRCLVTPHVAGLSKEARLRVDMAVAQAVLEALVPAKS